VANWGHSLDAPVKTIIKGISLSRLFFCVLKTSKLFCDLFVQIESAPMKLFYELLGDDDEKALRDRSKRRSRRIILTPSRRSGCSGAARGGIAANARLRCEAASVMVRHSGM